MIQAIQEDHFLSGQISNSELVLYFLYGEHLILVQVL